MLIFFAYFQFTTNGFIIEPKRITINNLRTIITNVGVLVMKTRVTQLLGIEHPVISAAMTWATSAEFVAAVSNAGGMGVLGPNAGQRKPSKSMEEFVENTRKEIQKVKTLTNKPFAVNYIFPFGENESNLFTDALFNVLIEENVKVVIAIGDEINKSELKRLKDNNIIVVFRHLNPTVDQIIEAEKLGVDALIVTGQEAGGHISKYPISTLSLLAQVSTKVSLPLIAAGGIVDGLGAKAVFAMNAEGVYMGTRFLATKENPASSTVKQAIIKVKSEEFLELEAAHVRTMPTEAGKKAYELINHGQLDKAKSILKDGYKVGILEGDLTNGTVSISPSSGGIQEIKTCQEVIDDIVQALS